ncbi:restriction endonuclease [Alicyclobacillus sp. SO9]|uniref:restriction endonuclease n=1 Tax=Alicyclobacillus sp. SO9 TaxID=2665646 RepID=UPI0018E80D2C|nr:restriction endonuclease [Alicyclobacillus sp. SO9]QQE80598.1 restriction endonuclease [Alicyclobacillus sp. SO9]
MNRDWMNRRLLSMAIAIGIVISLVTFHDTRLVLGITVLSTEASLAAYYVIRKKYTVAGLFAIAMAATALSFSHNPLLRNSDILIVALGIAAIGFYNKYFAAPRLKAEQLQRIEQSGIQQMEEMEPEAFLESMELHFYAKGWAPERTPRTNNHGANLVVNKPNGNRVAVRLRASREAVGTRWVEEVIGSRPYYHADAGMVITTSEFTAGAREIAKKNDIELWNRSDLIDSLIEVSEKQEQAEKTVQA